jgi:hypothetical protein
MLCILFLVHNITYVAGFPKQQARCYAFLRSILRPKPRDLLLNDITALFSSLAPAANNAGWLACADFLFRSGATAVRE